jgi:hypothetical protein
MMMPKEAKANPVTGKLSELQYLLIFSTFISTSNTVVPQIFEKNAIMNGRKAPLVQFSI